VSGHELGLLRPAQRGDEAALLPLIERYFTYDGIPFEHARVARGLEALLGDERLGRAYFILHEGAIAGYTIMTFGFDLEMGGTFGLLTDLYLDPPFRRRGLGRAVLDEHQARLHRLGISTIELHVEHDNLEAQGLYREVGFVGRERIPMTRRVDPA